MKSFYALSNSVGNGIERGQSTASIAKFRRVGGKVLLLEPNNKTGRVLLEVARFDEEFLCSFQQRRQRH